MAFEYATVSVGTTATSLVGDVEDTEGVRHLRSIEVTNLGAASVFIGGPGVTASTSGGRELAAGDSLPFNDLGAGDVPYAIAASGTVDVGVLHAGV